jgi:Ser/Thr protein kinase RdoA (MazF antagonist)
VSELIAAVAAEFELGPIEDIARPPTGTMNETYLVRAGGRRVVLRRHRRTDRSLVEREHEIMAHARERGIPIPSALRTRSGNRIVQYDGKWHSVFTWAPGIQVTAVDAGRAQSMGMMLARIHDALADFPVEPIVRPVPTIDGTLQLMQRIRAAIPSDTEEDRAAIAYLDSQADAVRQAIPPPDPAEPQQLVHGDYQHTNLFFDGDSVVAVIDWDKAESRCPTQEIVRALDLSLHMDPALCRPFVEGYRQIRPLDPQTLDSAAAIYDFETRHGLWVHDLVYLHNDDRVRQFLERPPFIPYSDRWQKVRDSL